MASAQADQLDTAVRANYPTALTQAATRFHYTDLKQQAYTSVPVAGGTYVVAAYSNGHVGAVVLLEQSTGGLKMNDALFGALGKDPEIKLRDVDADGNNDVVVVYNTGRGSETWIVAINGGKFVVMNPVEKEGHTLLSHPHLVDLGRNGAVDLVDVSVSGRGEDAVANYTHYVLANGKYIEA